LWRRDVLSWLVNHVRRLVKATWYSSAGLKLLAKEHTAFAKELLVLVGPHV